MTLKSKMGITLTGMMVLAGCMTNQAKKEKVMENEIKQEINWDKIAVSSLYFDNSKLLNSDSILIHPNAESAEFALEPEYIAISNDSKKAWVSLQENNAIAIVNIEEQKIEKVVGLGFKNHGKTGNGLDASHKDKEINIETYENLFGIYQPDTIAYYNIDGKDYVFTANEGEDLWVGDTKDELDVEDVILDSGFENAEYVQGKKKLGKLGIYKYLGDTDNDGDYDELYAFGARSFSIWDEDANLVFDSADDIEQQVANSEYVNGNYKRFNLDNDDEDMEAEKESDNSGPSPEGIDIGKVGERIYAFISLEKVSGIMVYDVTNPSEAKYASYINTRNFDASKEEMEANRAGDLGPEGIKFLSAEKSPIAMPLLLVSNEVSGTVTMFEVESNGTLALTGRYTTGAGFDDGGAEIVNYDYKTKKMLLVNGDEKSLDILDLSNLTQGVVDEYDTSSANRIKVSDLAEKLNGFIASDVTCVSVHPDGGIAAISVPAEETAIDKGRVIFFDTKTEEMIKDVEVGFLPDMLTFTPDGMKILVANEGEPEYKEVDGEEVSGYFGGAAKNDPEGSISVIMLATK